MLKVDFDCYKQSFKKSTFNSDRKNNLSPERQ
jgi:hypothetical protein